MPSELFREIRKFEIRLKDWLDTVGKLSDALQRSVDALKEFNLILDEQSKYGRDEAVKAYVKVVEALAEVLRLEGEAEHERSHLMESYSSMMRKIASLYVKVKSDD